MRLYVIRFEGLDSQSFAICEPGRIRAIVKEMAIEETVPPESDEDGFAFEGYDPYPIYVEAFPLDKEVAGYVSDDSWGYNFEQTLYTDRSESFQINSFEDFDA